MIAAEDDEWEYEYDETETEDFYVPLDLSNVPAAQIPMVSQGRPGHPTLLKSRLRALNAARGQPVEFASDATTTDGQEAATMGEIQIMGLHTSNPLVMYNGQLLSCHWTSTIGTDMFFAKPGANNTTPPPLRSLPAVDLLSLGSAKLVAKVAHLQPREDVVDQTSEPAAESLIHSAVATSGEKDEGQQLCTIGEAKPSSTSSFLARLNEAKAKRGETSQLALSKTPDGSRLVVEKADARRGTMAQANDDVAMRDL